MYSLTGNLASCLLTPPHHSWFSWAATQQILRIELQKFRRLHKNKYTTWSQHILFPPASTHNSSEHTTSCLLTKHLQSEEYSACDACTAAPSVDCGVDELLSDCALRTSAARGWSGSTTFKGWKYFEVGKKIKIGSTYFKNSSINIFGKENLSMLIDISNYVQTLKLLFL